MAITPSKSVKPDNGVDYHGRIKCTLEGSNDVTADMLVVVTDVVFNSDGVARKLKVSRVTAATQEGMILVAKTAGAVGDEIEGVRWKAVQFDTSAGALYDEVYMAAGGTATLTGTRGTDTPVGVVHKVATVANGGFVILNPGGRAAIDYLI